ncbi:MAG: glycosyltransferase [Flavobacterium sp.]|nr:MAG: glycosyltransferase [Flavobacterium sp.]
MIKKIYPQKRIILMAHGIEVWQNLSNWKVQFLKKHCEIWAVSRYTASKLIAKGISDSKIQILNNCLDPFFKLPESFQKPQHLLERYQLSSDQPIIFTLTRLSSLEKYKGYDIVINSLKELLVVHPKLHYILAGKADEEEKERILNLIKSNDLEKHITLTGFLKDEEVNDHYLLADLFVMPSQGEGFGIAFIEAAACGCAAIAGNKDGSIDALLNGELGTLIDPDDTMELRKAIENSLAIIKSAEKSRLLQEKCKMHFSFESYKKNVLDLLTTSPRPSDKSEQVLLKERELTQPQPSP